VHKEFDGMGREQLERLAKQYLDNLTSVQTRCTELKEENRLLRSEFEAIRSVGQTPITRKHSWQPTGRSDVLLKCNFCGATSLTSSPDLHGCSL
jgi:FtsZ-binding cell division protein ZapB